VGEVERRRAGDDARGDVVTTRLDRGAVTNEVRVVRRWGVARASRGRVA